MSYFSSHPPCATSVSKLWKKLSMKVNLTGKANQKEKKKKAPHTTSTVSLLFLIAEHSCLPLIEPIFSTFKSCHFSVFGGRKSRFTLSLSFREDWGQDWRIRGTETGSVTIRYSAEARHYMQIACCRRSTGRQNPKTLGWREGPDDAVHITATPDYSCASNNALSGPLKKERKKETENLCISFPNMPESTTKRLQSHYWCESKMLPNPRPHPDFWFVVEVYLASWISSVVLHNSMKDRTSLSNPGWLKLHASCIGDTDLILAQGN